MAWGSKTSSTQLTSVSTEQFFSQTPTLGPGETAHVEVDANSSGTTDRCIVAVYGTLDAATEDWDDTPLLELEIDNVNTDPNKVSFLLSGVYKFRVGVRRSGTTDTFTVDMAHRLDGVSL